MNRRKRLKFSRMVDLRADVDANDDRRRDSIDWRLKFNVVAQTFDDGIDPDVVIIDLEKLAISFGWQIGDVDFRIWS